MSVWARVPKARLAAWAPDGSLLVTTSDADNRDAVFRISPAAG